VGERVSKRVSKQVPLVLTSPILVKNLDNLQKKLLSSHILMLNGLVGFVEPCRISSECSYANKPGKGCSLTPSQFLPIAVHIVTKFTGFSLSKFWLILDVLYYTRCTRTQCAC